MATVRLHLDQSRVTIGELLQLEELSEQGSKARLRDLHDALLGFVVDEGGAPLDSDAASAAIRLMTVGDMMTSVQSLYEALQERALPPTTGSA